MWEQQYAEAHARYESHQKQIAEARKADAEAERQRSGGPAPSSYTERAGQSDRGGALTTEEALAVLRERMSDGGGSKRGS